MPSILLQIFTQQKAYRQVYSDFSFTSVNFGLNPRVNVLIEQEMFGKQVKLLTNLNLRYDQ